MCAYLHVASITSSPSPPFSIIFRLQLYFSFPHIYPFTLGSSETVQFGCNHPGSCSDLGGQQPTVVTVSPSLVGNNDISDCHRFCSLVLERSATTKCKFAFPDGNRLSLVVLDDDGRSLAWSCQYARQLIYVYLIYACIQYWPWSFHMSTLPSSCNCHVILPPSLHHFPLSVHLYYSVHFSLLNRRVCQFLHYSCTSP